MEKKQIATIMTISLAVLSVIYIIWINLTLSNFKIKNGPRGKAGKNGDDGVNITCKTSEKKKCLT